jgi:hypothetical protein
MRKLAILATALMLSAGSTGLAQEEAPEPPFEPHVPGVMYEMPATLAPAHARMPIRPLLPPPADPRMIYFAPYFYPTHFNFRPFPYGYPPPTFGFYYGALASPYYNQYYGPGEYHGY